MSVFIFRRFLTLIATLVGASLIIFLVLDALPGNAAQMLMGADASPDAVRALTVKLGLDQPLHYRYVHWIKGLLTGDLGNSYAYGTPVAGLIAERLVLTIPLAIMSMSMRPPSFGVNGIGRSTEPSVTCSPDAGTLAHASRTGWRASANAAGSEEPPRALDRPFIVST